MPTIDLPDDELAAVAAAIRGVIAGDRYPHAPRLDPLRAALARLDAAAAANAAPGQPDVKENKGAQNHAAANAATAPAKSSFPKKLASKPTPDAKAPPPAKADK